MSRKQLWNVVRAHKSACAVILTTHSMQVRGGACMRACVRVVLRLRLPLLLSLLLWLLSVLLLRPPSHPPRAPLPLHCRRRRSCCVTASACSSAASSCAWTRRARSPRASQVRVRVGWRAGTLRGGRQGAAQPCLQPHGHRTMTQPPHGATCPRATQLLQRCSPMPPHPTPPPPAPAGSLILTLTVPEAQEAEARALAEALAPSATLTYALGGTVKYVLPRTEAELSAVFLGVHAAAARGLRVKDWAVTSATLEEVFIRLARAAYDHELE